MEAGDTSADLGERLVGAGLLGSEQLAEGRSEARRSGTSLEDALIESGQLGEGALLDFLARHYGLAFPDLSGMGIDTEAGQWLPEHVARAHLAAPTGWRGGRLRVATPYAHHLRVEEELAFHVGKPVDLFLADRRWVRTLLARLYGSEAERPAPRVAEEGAPYGEADGPGDAAGQEGASAVELVNDFLARAVAQGASDIHVEATEEGLAIRFRVDGLLRPFRELPSDLRGPVLSRIKVLGGMDISDRRRPQDGRFRTRFRGRRLDVRIATLPTFWGEKAVLRLLDRTGGGLGLASLGLLRGEQQKLEELIRRPQGLVLVTGPTGSGKTTTLYALLRALNSPGSNIVTVEDPVEVQLRGVNQVPVNPKAGVDFAHGLRAILRQDPDIIMVGEIRDRETAETALEAAETGHLVLSTLHTTSALGAVTRLVDMGVPRYLLADSISAVLAQRLVPLICPQCAEPDEVADATRRAHGIPTGVTLYTSAGCGHCGGRGRYGRIGVYELLVADTEVRRAIHHGVPEDELLHTARGNGMHRMFEDALIKAMQGRVALDDVLDYVDSGEGSSHPGSELLAFADHGWQARRRGSGA